MNAQQHQTRCRKHLRRRVLATAALSLLSLGGVVARPAQAQFVDPGELLKEGVKTVAIGAAVNAAAKPLNQFINTVTLRHGIQDRQTTKVVPMLSLGDKGYIGGAQVSGPSASLAKVKAVWQVEGSKKIGDGVYRVKALVPSDSLSPLSIRRVQKVGINAVIDVATGGPLRKEGPYSKGVRGVDIAKTAAIAVAVNAAARPINDFVNTVTLNKSALSTKVVPAATLGEKAFIGAAQLSGSTTTLPQAKALFQYEDLFDRGRFRVKILIPVNGVNVTKIKRVQGVGLTALLDTTMTRQVDSLQARRPEQQGGGSSRGQSLPFPGGDAVRLPGGLAPNGVDPRALPPGIAKKYGLGRHDNGRHKGWDKQKEKGKGKGRDRDDD